MTTLEELERLADDIDQTVAECKRLGGDGSALHLAARALYRAALATILVEDDEAGKPSDTDEYRAAHACTQRAEAAAIREGRY